MEKTGCIQQILGIVASPNAEIRGSYIANTTRWVFDLEHHGKEPVTVVLEHRYASQKVRPLVQSFSLAPLSASFTEAAVWVEEKRDAICLHASRPCKMRVAIDTVHSLAR